MLEERICRRKFLSFVERKPLSEESICQKKAIITRKPLLEEALCQKKTFVRRLERDKRQQNPGRSTRAIEQHKALEEE